MKINLTSSRLLGGKAFSNDSNAILEMSLYTSNLPTIHKAAIFFKISLSFFPVFATISACASYTASLTLRSLSPFDCMVWCFCTCLFTYIYVCVCVCVLERERERERKRDIDRERKRDIDREREKERHR